MLAIHSIHRKLALIAYMSMDRDGNMIIGEPELRLIMPLLRANLDLVRRIDELKELAYTAQVAGDMAWVQEVCQKIDEMEAKLV